MNPAVLLKNEIVIFIIYLMINHSKGQNASICATNQISCPKTKYRSYDASCNNLAYPGWGATYSRYNRLLPANYGDGISTPSVAKDGTSLPNSREISFTVYPDVHVEDPTLTLIVMQYGQVLAHDISKTMFVSQTGPQATECCSLDGKILKYATDPDVCYPIIIPPNDPVYTKAGIGCFQFARTGTDLQFGCGKEDQPVQQLSQVNSIIDLSLVYGNSDADNKNVRLFQGGKLKAEKRLGQELLPRSLIPSAQCVLVDPQEPCYLAGDIRVNQNPQLAVLQTILLREHNRIADTLAKLNPRWNDEIIFQEARKINIGQHQKIVYYDLLPHFLGKKNMFKRKLIQNVNGFVNDYNATVNPSILNEHATAASRFFHSNIAGLLDLVNEKRKTKEEARISDSFNRPRILEEDKKSIDDLTRGLVTQHQYEADEFHDEEITNYWARLPGQKLGQDLKAICIQRGRDHGLPTYNDLREYCGFPRARNFSDFLDFISKKNVQKLSKLYKSPEDVDLSVGGSLEKLVPNTLAGPTFLCIMTEQFYRTRVGDRFFFENSGETGFSLPQLKEIRKASISKLICDNTEIKNMQPDGFVKISDKNSLTHCKELPSVNLALWKE